MKWEKVTLGELVKNYGGKIQTGPFGSQLHQHDYKSDGIPVIMPKDIINDRFNTASIAKISEDDADRLSKHKLNLGDLVLPRRGDINKRAICKQENEGWICGTGCLKIRLNDDIVDSNYLYYYFSLSHVVESILNKAVGSTMLNLSGTILASTELVYPPLPTQRKIANILSAYDDLIENNLKRIKLLEEKAFLHYKELMQELKSAKTKREVYIKDCLSFYIGGGWGEEEYKEGFTEAAYVIRGTDIPDARSGTVSGIPLRFHKPSNLESRKMQIGDIVFEVSNGQINNIGRTVLASQRLLGQFDKPVICASFAKLIRVNENVSPEFFYLYLNEGQENGLLYQYKSNSANGINNFAFEKFIDAVKIILPKESELKVFSAKVQPIFSLISNLGEQNTKLREARDILLPRLMNGEIEV